MSMCGPPPRSHGEWPMYPPNRFRGEEMWLYEMAVAWLESCGPDCDAMCVCQSDEEDLDGRRDP